MSNKDPHYFELGETIVDVPLESEMKKSYLEYAMSVIIGRALPDIRDGLKPVHRRILFSMLEIGNLPNKPFKKSAKIVGQVLGNYHPHGESSIYDSIVRMAQEFSLRYPLVEGHGNFGSIDGDSPAAMRYTEVRLSKISLELLDEINQETVSFMDNFDATAQEPTYLPSKIPNLLLNGSSGIAVGMATNIPPHHLGEIIDGLVLVIDKADCTVDDLMGVIKGPDFPTGGRIAGSAGIRSYFETGRGSIRLQGIGHVEEESRHNNYIIDELPYQVNKAELIKKIAELAKDKKIQGITDLRDESDRNGIRVVIELKKNINPFIFENQLYKMTQYQVNFGVIMLSLVNQIPRELGMIDLLKHFIEHRETIITKRTEFELKKSRARKHILEGLRIGIQNIDRVIEIIRAAEDPQEARTSLIEAFSLTEPQVGAILDMSLSKLTNLENKRIEDETEKLSQYIQSLEFIIATPENLRAEIRKELVAIKDRYNDKRLTEIVPENGSGSLMDEDLIHDDKVVVIITKDGYIKRMKSEAYKTQIRGGKGNKIVMKKPDDEIKDIFCSSNHQHILFFTNLGKVYSKKIYLIPEADRTQKGTPLSYMLPLDAEEFVCTAISFPEFKASQSFIMVTEKGVVKRILSNAFDNIRKTGIRAIKLREDDNLKKVRLISEKDIVLIVTKNGYAVRFAPTFRDMGRNSMGIRGIRVAKDDQVIGMEIEEPKLALLCLTENGYGKVTPFEKFRQTKRGAKGVKAMKIDLKTGPIAACRTLDKKMKLIITTSNGKVIQIQTQSIPQLSRISRGARLIRVDEDDKVIAVARDLEDIEE
jgi:DNA gyrase subunit A